MIAVFRPNDMTPEGREAYKACSKFHKSHLRYNQRLYYDKADQVYFTEDDEGGIYTGMLRVK